MNWKSKADKVASETTLALQMVYNNLNQGQRQKLLKEKEIKELFDR